MMPLEELVMMPLENTYISFLQKNTCERVLSRRLYYYHLPGWDLCIRSILMTFARRAIFISILSAMVICVLR